MKKIVLAALALLTCAAAFGQEVVVFRDYRALAVLSHRIQGKWTYLRLPEGELAVLSTTIREYRKEPAAPAAPVSNAPAPGARAWKPEPAPPPPPPQYNPEPPPPPEPVYEPPPEEPMPPPDEPVDPGGGEPVKAEKAAPNIARRIVD